MKKILFSFFLCLCAVIGSAQDQFHHEFAVDAAPLIRSSNGFTVLYRYYTNNIAFRGQANIYFENTSNDIDNKITTPASTNSISTTSSSVNIFNTEFRLGVQRNWNYEKWGFYAGTDILAGSGSNETKTDIKSPQSFGTTRNVSDNKTSSTLYGIAPVIGIQYKVNNRFVISLENSFTFSYTQNTSSQKTDYYFTPVNGVESLNNTSLTSADGGSTKFDFSPAKYLRIFIGFKF